VVRVVPYFAALALVIIMFDGGLNLNIKNVIANAKFSLTLAVLGFFASAATTMIIAAVALGWTWFDAFLLGSMVGGSSSIIVFGLVRRLKITNDTKSMLSLESAITDILAFVVVFVLIEVLLSGQVDPSTIAMVALKAIITGVLLGFGIGIPWLFIYSRLSNAAHVSMLTLGMLFVLFFLANSFGESGALTAMVFGLMLGNREFFAKKLKLRIAEGIAAKDPFHERVTFLVRSFFFVFVGLLASFGRIEFILAGIGIAAALLVARKYVTKISVRDPKFSAFDKIVTTFMMPRGLAAAVLATLPLTLGVPNANAYPQIVFIIILSSVLITTVGLARYRKQAETSSAATATTTTAAGK
jgi:cell volume regulation protein A